MSREGKLLKDIDAWTEVFVFDPISLLFVKILKNIKFLHPLHFTFLSGIVKIVGAYYIFQKSFVVAAVLFFIGVIFDGIDGKIARSRNLSIELHGTLDFITDQISNTIYLGALIFNIDDPLKSFLIIYLGISFVLMSLGSTKYRLLTKSKPDEIEIHEGLQNHYLEKSSSFPVFSKLANLYARLIRTTSKFRILPHPTEVDVEYLIFIALPLAFTYNLTNLIIGIEIFSFITLTIMLAYTLALDIILTLSLSE